MFPHGDDWWAWFWTYVLRKPIYWDPIPPWIRLNQDQLQHYAELENRFNTQMAGIQKEFGEKLSALQTQKVQEIEKMVGHALNKA